MKKEALFKFKIIFENQRRNLLYSNAVLNDAFDLPQDDLIDNVDLTSTELETSMRLRLRNREALFLKKIEAALERITSGTFGLCVDCGADIELKRLEARPTATLCFFCKEEQERSELLHIDGHRSKSLGARLRIT